MSGLLGRGGSTRAPSGRAAPEVPQLPQSSPEPTLALAAASAAPGPRRNRSSRSGPASHTAFGTQRYSRKRAAGTECCFALTRILEGLEGACARGAACCVIADASQCRRANGRPCDAWRALALTSSSRGHSVREAYVQDGRGPVVGGGLKGLHHAKALLLVGDTTAELVVGSLNWTTSSKANSECGVHLVLASSSPVVTDYSREFDRVSGSAERLEDANPSGSKPAAVSSGARQASAPPTATV